MPQPASRQRPALPPAPSHRTPAYPEPAHREPAPGPGQRQEWAAEPAPSGWNHPVQGAAGWQQPAPLPLPAPLPAAPSGAPAGWPEIPVSHGGANGSRITHGQQALPSGINRPFERERPADPSGEDVRVTRPTPKGVWD